LVTTSTGRHLVTFTNGTGTTFTGCQGGTGVMSTGGAIEYIISLGDGAASNVTSTIGFPSAGAVLINTNLGLSIATYASTTATQFGNLSGLGQVISPTITAAPIIAPGTQGTTATSGTVSTTPSTLTVVETRGFPSSGTFTLNVPGAPVTVTYTGIGSNTTFTGCTIATGSTVLVSGWSISTFPLKGVCVRGVTTSALTSTPWFSTNTVAFTPSNNGQIACVNATPATGVTADGSFYAVASFNASGGTPNTVGGLMYTRLDDTEPGDIDPYAFFESIGDAVATWTNQSSINQGTNTYISISNVLHATCPQFIGYAARGCSVTSRDLPTVWQGSIYGTALPGVANAFVTMVGYPNLPRNVNHPSTTPPLIREPILLYTAGPAAQLSPPQIKGKTRWINIAGAGQCYDTFDNKTWLAVSFTVSPVATTTTPAILFGPYDGSTTPTQ
jgi:hypothetical protein